MKKSKPYVETEYARAFYDQQYLKQQGKVFYSIYYEYFYQLLKQREIQICDLYWGQKAMTQTQIAEQLKLSKNSIGRLLGQSKRTVVSYLLKR